MEREEHEDMSNPEGKQTSGKGPVNKTIDPEVFKLNAGLCQAMANEKRIEIIYHLAGGKKSATQLRELTELSKSSLSQHMSILVDKGLAKSIPHGKFVEYEIAGEGVIEVYKAIAKLCRENLEKQRKLARQL